MFELSVKAHHGKSKALRSEAQTEFEELQKSSLQRIEITPEMLTRIQTWRHFALLELLDLKDCQHSVGWFAYRLGLPLEQTTTIVNDLIAVGLLNYDGERYRIHQPEGFTSSDIPSTAIRDFHSTVLDKAKSKLKPENVKSREFINATFAFSSQDLKEAKDSLRDFQESFTQRFHSKSQNKDCVYQLSIQFFRLDEDC